MNFNGVMGCDGWMVRLKVKVFWKCFCECVWCVEIILMCSTVSRVKSAEEMVKSKGRDFIHRLYFLLLGFLFYESVSPDRG